MKYVKEFPHIFFHFQQRFSLSNRSFIHIISQTQNSLNSMQLSSEQ